MRWQGVPDGVVDLVLTSPPYANNYDYSVELAFLSLPDVEMSIERVAMRVKQGGHNVPEDVIRCRFAHGIANFERYKWLVDSW